MRRSIIVLLIALLVISIAGCKALKVATKAVTTAGVYTGTISSTQAQSIEKGTEAVGKAFEKFTPENEYYIGRTIAANILGKYKVYQNSEAIKYVNLVGQTVARASDKPETFRGYHVLILDTDEINAFATPGGFILVTRGLLRCCKTEDAVAAVLAHEVGHVQLDHGMGAIKGSRYTNLGKVAGVEIAKNMGGAQLAQAAEIFDGTVGDIMKNLVDKGYQAGQEYDADAVAVDIMKRVGYNPMALKEMLDDMDKRLGPSAGGFGKTHPSPKKRLEKVGALVKDCGTLKSPAARQARLNKALAKI